MIKNFTLRHALFIFVFIAMLVTIYIVKVDVLNDEQAHSNFTPKALDNFLLLDQYGDAHELFDYDDAAAVVIMVHGVGCPIVRNLIPDYLELAQENSNKKIHFLLLNSNLQDSRQTIYEEAVNWNIDLPILIDESQLVGERLGLTRTAEVLVVDPRSRQIVYRGPLNNRVTYGAQKQYDVKQYARDALTALQNNKPVLTPDSRVKGCLINFPGKGLGQSEDYYSSVVAPILVDKCVVCHRPNGIAPWAMSNHLMIQGFAPMIEEVLLLGRMPPWSADPHIGSWKEDRSLSMVEKQSLVHWIRAGAPRGEGPDPLVGLTAGASSGWRDREPDLVLNIPEYEIPASGVVEYKFPIVVNPLEEDVWVEAIDIQPGDPQALHHIYVGSTPSEANGHTVRENFFGLWSPGSNSGVMPPDTAVRLSKGSNFAFEIHYTPYGKEARDNTKVGFYFSSKAPKKIMRYGEIFDPTLLIPAGEDNFAIRAYYQFEYDATLYSLFPHSHYRGKKSTYFLRYPDGREQLLLSVPTYDFNWQLHYSFDETVKVPAGSKLIYTTYYDNSIKNDANPDPNRDVPWGLQSEDEMLLGAFLFTWDEETPDNVINYGERNALSRLMGYVDKDMDGVITFDQVQKRNRGKFYKLFHLGDRNKDGKLTYEEIISTVD